MGTLRVRGEVQMADMTFDKLDKNQTDVVSEIGLGNDKGHPIGIIAGLLCLRYIEAVDDGYQMLLPVHIRWCAWRYDTRKYMCP